ncbi:hypothetical protein E1287_36940 [Actinomadura sp. KC06]|uniref:hypothetical protein n=1 Tax=Actinomadura sp. KC06 TaxID=2530369 RepID=UPI001047E834|nr:hypothetical protein [Actinomadura sp. KC06]TDD25852.1 hypothetical protein E1287_36940 [Actinomadura sp. KC06]
MGAGDDVVRADVLRDLLLGRNGMEPPPQPGVILNGVRLAGVMDLRGMELGVGLFLEDCTVLQPIKVSHARIPRLVLTRSKLAGLEANDARIDNGLDAREIICTGPVELHGTRIGGQTNFTGARISASTRVALLADDLRSDGDLLLRASFRGGGGAGAVRLVGATVEGNLDLVGAEIAADGGAALLAERADVGGNLLLRGLRARGRGDGGRSDAAEAAVVVLRGATVRGQLSLEGADLTGEGMCALAAEGVRAETDVFLTRMRATGAHPDGVVWFTGAEIGGSLVCDGATVTGGAGGRAVDLRMVTLGRTLSMRPDLAGTSGRDLVALDGLTYRMVPHGMTCAEWIAFLRDRACYAAQPYRQLADVYTAAGWDDDARKVLIAQQDDLLAGGRGLSSAERLRLRVLRIVLGYGYQTWRALVGLALTIVAAVILTIMAAQTTDAVQVPQRPGVAPATASGEAASGQGEDGRTRDCQFVDQVGLGIELAIPLLNTTRRTRCNLIATSSGEQWIVAAGWAPQFLGWAFATLFVAGYTKLIRPA